MQKLLKHFIFLNIITIGSFFLMTERVAALSVSCSVSKEIAPTYESGNNTVDFTSNITDGTGPFTVEWTGDLTASGNSFSETFTDAGYYSVEVSVTDSLGATASEYCPTVIATAVLEYNSCNPKGEMNTHLGYESVWKADISGGIAPYSMTWSGTEGLSGSSDETDITYTTIGEKTASVANISSADGQSVIGTFNCEDPILVYEVPTDLESVSCSVNDTSSRTGSEVTWSATVNGGKTPYMYSWSGTDGLTGSNSAVNKSYSTAGTKTASVSVTTADGQSLLNVACNNSTSVTPSTSGGSGRTRTDDESDETSDTNTTGGSATTTDINGGSDDVDGANLIVTPRFDGYYYTSTPVNNVLPSQALADVTSEVSIDQENIEDTQDTNNDSESENVVVGNDEGLEDSQNNLNLASAATLAFDNTVNFVFEFWYVIFLHLIIIGLATYLIIRK